MKMNKLPTWAKAPGAILLTLALCGAARLQL